jgi:uncharacterized protein YndB with AHSA1/START domain
MTDLPYRLDRTVIIQAARETIFRYFTDTARWAAWWGAGSAIEPRPGGTVRIRYPNGVEAAGEVIEILSPERFVFTFGYASGNPIPPGASRVTILLEAHETGTRLHLSHAFADSAVCEQHLPGWRFQLSLFANVVTNEIHSGAAGLIDQWYGLWSVADAKDRQDAIARLAAPGVGFRDAYSLLEGIADLAAHIGAYQRFMPGLRWERHGEIRHCQGTALADWIAVAADGQTRATGTSVFVLGKEGRIESVMGFWNQIRNP